MATSKSIRSLPSCTQQMFTPSTISASDTSPYIPVKPEPSANLLLPQHAPKLQNRIVLSPTTEPTARHEPANQTANVISLLDGGSTAAALEKTALIKHEKGPIGIESPNVNK